MARTGVVLTAEKGLAMVVMDKEDYIKKAESLLTQPAYRTKDSDPINQIKPNLINKLRKIEKDTNMDEGMYKIMYPTGCIPQSSMDYQKSIKQVLPLSLSYTAGVQLHMGWPKSLPGYINPL